MLKLINEDHGTDSTVREVLGAIESLKESLPEIYDHLISLTSLLKDENIEQFKKPGQVKDIAEVTANNAEEKNSFALSVLRRIKMKLDGREPDVLRKATGNYIKCVLSTTAPILKKPSTDFQRNFAQFHEFLGN